MRHKTGGRSQSDGGDREDPDEDEEDSARSPGQDLRHALGLGQQEPGLGLAGREADRVGQLQHQQGARHPTPQLLGDDLRLCSQW